MSAEQNVSHPVRRSAISFLNKKHLGTVVSLSNTWPNLLDKLTKQSLKFGFK
jgi:hypothetical protein